MGNILWNTPKFGKTEVKEVTEVLESGYVSEGPKTKELEEKLAKILGVKHVIMTTSCTAALHLALEADKKIRNYTKGRVIIPNVTFVATKNAVEMAGLDYELTDVEPGTYVMNYNVKLADKDMPKAIICVNLLGRRPKEMTTMVKPSVKPTVICDNAGAFGSDVSNGDIGCYSLQSNKLITCGQGGFCATDDDTYDIVLRQLKDFGRKFKEDNQSVGFNYKFNDILAAVVLGQLRQFEARKKLAKKEWQQYHDAFPGSVLGGGTVPLWIEFDAGLFRNELVMHLAKNGVGARLPWDCLEDNSFLYPISRRYQDNIIWLPNGPNVTPKDIRRIIKLIKEFDNEVFQS